MRQFPTSKNIVHRSSPFESSHSGIRVFPNPADLNLAMSPPMRASVSSNQGILQSPPFSLKLSTA